MTYSGTDLITYSGTGLMTYNFKLVNISYINDAIADIALRVEVYQRRGFVLITLLFNGAAVA